MNPEVQAKAQARLESMYERLKKSWPGFQARAGQEAMMDVALATFLNAREPGAPAGEGENIALVEGPTGTGKTLGYLLAAIAAAQVMQKTIVISTATVALQDQLMQKDLPRLKECLGTDLTFDILKGRQRYVCLQKLARSGSADPELLEMFGPESSTPSRRDPRGPVTAYGSAPQAELDLAAEMTRQFDAGKWDGDRDKWPQVVADDAWIPLAADNASCTRRNCSQFKRCAFYEARKRAAGATIQVANHALVLATLANDANTIDPGKTCFVFDEGHHVVEVGVERFKTDMHLSRTARALARSRAMLPKVAAMRPKAAWVTGVASALDAARESVATIERIQADVLDDPQLALNPQVRFEEGRLPETWVPVIEQLAATLQAVLTIVGPASAELLEEGSDEAAGDKEKAQHLASEWAPWVTTLVEGESLLKQWRSHERVPLAKWISVHQQTGNVTLSCSPLTAAKALNDQVWSRVGAALVTSATITACGTFDFFVRLSGLNRYPQRTEVIAPSAFNYDRQARLCIPKMRSSPKDGPSFTAELIKLMPDLLDPFEAGQLCLFASRRQMEAVFSGMPRSVASVILMQDSLPRARLLTEHRERVERGRRSVLFGLQSLGEGIDLPGRLCEHVVIEKVPFTPPDSPVDAALAEWLTSQHRDPFAEVSVPKAGVKLAQWAGRAVRTVNDRAVITICDTRLRTARYGRRLLQGLPRMPSVAHPREAKF